MIPTLCSKKDLKCLCCYRRLFIPLQSGIVRCAHVSCCKWNTPFPPSNSAFSTPKSLYVELRFLSLKNLFKIF